MKNSGRSNRRTRRRSRVSPMAADAAAREEFSGRELVDQVTAFVNGEPGAFAGSLSPAPESEPKFNLGDAPESLRAFVRHGI